MWLLSGPPWPDLKPCHGGMAPRVSVYVSIRLPWACPGHAACGLAVLLVGLQPSAASGETDGSGASVSGLAAASLDPSRPLRMDCPSICSGLNPLRPDPHVLPAQPGAYARFGPLGLLCTSARPCTPCCLLQTMASGDPGSCVIAEPRTASPAGPSHSPKATATSLLPAEGGVWSRPVAGLRGRLAVCFHSRGTQHCLCAGGVGVVEADGLACGL